MRYSFEFFPPASEDNQAKLNETVQRLASFDPVFLSVTYGAGGSAPERSLYALARLRERFPFALAAHLTCAGASRAQVDLVAKRFWSMGINHIIAVRGDPPKGQTNYQAHAFGYRYGRDLVEGLARLHPFEISVAAYPEGHVESPSAVFDLDVLKSKQEAGASSAITQAFYDADLFLRFRDRAAAHGISLPIIPAILPIMNIRRTLAFAAQNNVSVPAGVVKRFAGCEPGDSVHFETAAEIGAALMQNLQKHGAERIHFYTMNKAPLVTSILARLG